jgi:hypothetical protein
MTTDRDGHARHAPPPPHDEDRSAPEAAVPCRGTAALRADAPGPRGRPGVCAGCPLAEVCAHPGGTTVLRLQPGETVPLARRGEDEADRFDLTVLCEGCLKTVIEGMAEAGARPPLVALHLPGETVHPARGRRGGVRHVAAGVCTLRSPAAQARHPGGQVGPGAAPLWHAAWADASRRAERDGLRLAALGAQPPARRLAGMLIDLLARMGEGTREGPASLRLPLGRDDVAAYLGVEPETVSRAFSTLQRRGLLRRRGWGDVHLPEPDRLARFAGLMP